MAEPLPIYEIEAGILKGVRECRRLVVSAPTGSGKSTQVPQMLLKAGLLDSGQAVVLQPRRIAARLLAARVAEELRVELGTEVGYQVRFENCAGPKTRVRFVTEGVLLRQMTLDPRLEGVATLIFDEFHERHLYGDVTLARALDLQETTRPDLRVIVMSATLDVERLQDYLGSCRTLEAPGRTFPVEIQYAEVPSYVEKRPVWTQAAEVLSRYVREGGQGDVLVFMPGGFEIGQTIEAIRDRPELQGLVLLPLHGELPPRDQDAAVARYEKRKVVVATNVAETSLTIDGVRCVIDSGLARVPQYDAYRGINTLLVEKISRASADQRAGRAGRTAPGVCFRLWTRAEHGHRPERESPEIKRVDLAEVILTLHAAGVTDSRRFRWIDPPEERALMRAEELLLDLGAVESVRTAAPERTDQPAGRRLRITDTGRRMLAFPVHPRFSRLLMAAQQHGCVYEACLVAALTQGRDILAKAADRATALRREEAFAGTATSDFQALMAAWEYAARVNFAEEQCHRHGIHASAARQVGPILRQFLRLAEREGFDTCRHEAADEAFRKCVLVAFSDRVGRLLDPASGRCELVHNRRGVLARESVVRTAPLFVAAEVREVEGREISTRIAWATAIEEGWLKESFPEDIQESDRVFFDTDSKRVCAERQTTFRGLAISTRRVEPPPTEAAAKLLADEVRNRRLAFDDWDDSVEQWIIRLNELVRWCPELELPPLSAEDRDHLVEQICHGCLNARDVKTRPVKPVVRSWLNARQQSLLDKHAPERLRLSNGRTPKVHYEPGQPPRIGARIQELYDVATTPRIAMGRVPVVLQILAPSMRPVQVTQDLASFWREHYPRVRQELRRRYPKHEWR